MRRESEQTKSLANAKGTLRSTRLSKQELKRLIWMCKWRLQWTGNSRMNRKQWFSSRRWMQPIRSEILLWNLSRINKQRETGLKCSADKKSRRLTTSKWWLLNRKMKPATNDSLTKLLDKIVLVNRLRKNCRGKPMNNSNTNQKCRKWKKKSLS